MTDPAEHHEPPVGWNRTIDGLMEELRRGERASIDGQQAEWARAFERDQIAAAGLRFPREGDVFEALEDTPVDFLTHWLAPYTGGGTGVLRKGERVVIEEPADDRPVAVPARPQDAAVEARLVPAEERDSPRYGGFSLTLRTVDLNRRFRLVSPG